MSCPCKRIRRAPCPSNDIRPSQFKTGELLEDVFPCRDTSRLLPEPPWLPLGWHFRLWRKFPDVLNGVNYTPSRPAIPSPTWVATTNRPYSPSQRGVIVCIVLCIVPRCFQLSCVVQVPENKKCVPPLIPLGETHFSSGGDKGSRTPDLLNAIETLYQLSYIPTSNQVLRTRRNEQ